MAHISTKIMKKGEVSLYMGGSMVSVKEKREKLLPKKGGGKRSTIKGFSKSSRRRLMKTMGKIKRDKLPMMITLTYPGEYSSDPKEWKKDLKLFLKRLSYHYFYVAGVWKLEPQKRAAPHYHLIVWGLKKKEILEIRKFVSLSWYQVVGSGDERHLLAGTRVELINSWNGVWSYTAKYLGKEVENSVLWDQVGRYWGVFCRDNVPWAELQVFEVGITQVYRAIRYFRRYGGLRSNGYYSLTCYVIDVDRWKRAIMSGQGLSSYKSFCAKMF